MIEEENMAFIRNKEECLVGVQDIAPWSPETDLQYDFVMVYGIDSGMPDRVKK